ncbi:MAG: ABC transporter permease [Cereibacter sphaeroides]|uniref:ABC transporter permease n=1 Tax=Cereibacter sphaeroides TaxID=1063 RepID=A0A2W5UTB1_CERSP|nr:MAG: ABC transporter permease [Cereibacter sphaeroides]
MTGPIAAGLSGTVMTAADGGFTRLWNWPGLGAAVRLSVVTGVAATLLSVGITLAIVAGLHGGRLFGAMTRALSPLLALPHAAAALGLAFLIAPSGWIARMISPWATGWQQPPDILILNDPMGLSLIAGLVIKEVPFLLLMVLAALPQADAARRQMLTASLGYGRGSGWLFAVLPAIWPQIRLPVIAVLAYSMTNVDMAMILGPTRPPTLSMQVVLWMTSPDLMGRAPASAGALLQLGLVLGVLALLWGAERVIGCMGRLQAVSGRRLRWLDRPLSFVGGVSGLTIVALVAAGMAGLAVWSFAGLWSFPDALPVDITLRTWRQAAPALAELSGTTLALGFLSTGAALLLTIGCLEAEARFGWRPGQRALVLLWLPLIMPQVAFLPGLAVLSLRAGLPGGLWTVAAAHLVFVLPYVFLSLSEAWRAWDGRIAVAGATLGASPLRILWQLRLPMLLGAILTASAVGLAVSVGQYLPTLLIGGGRVETLTTEAIALSAGGNRRIIGAYAILQLLLPAIGFWLALLLPALAFRHRLGMRSGV